MSEDTRRRTDFTQAESASLRPDDVGVDIHGRERHFEWCVRKADQQVSTIISSGVSDEAYRRAHELLGRMASEMDGTLQVREVWTGPWGEP